MHLIHWLLSCLVCVLVAYLAILLRSWFKITRLRKRGLSIWVDPPAWYILMKLILPKRQDFNSHVRTFQELIGLNNIFIKERVFAAYLAGQYLIHVYKPEHIEAVLSSSTILDKSSMYNLLKPWLGAGLLTSTGTKWKNRRKLLTPAFHFKILERFIPIFNTQSSILIKNLASKSNEYIDVVPLLSLCTLDIIGETAMGVEIKSQLNESSDYVKAIKQIENIFMTRAMYPWMWFDAIFYLTPTAREFKKQLKIVHSFTKQVISEKKKEMLQQSIHSRKEENETDAENMYFQIKERRAFLDLLLYLHLTDNSISEEDIREEVDTFMFEKSVRKNTKNEQLECAIKKVRTKLGESNLTSIINQLGLVHTTHRSFDLKFEDFSTASIFYIYYIQRVMLKCGQARAFGAIGETYKLTWFHKGHDTTSMGISWALYNLGLYQEIQDRAYQELYRIFGDDRERAVTIDDIREMKFIECVLKETLRLYPPVPFIGRSLTKDIEINGVPLPKNSIINIFIYSVHHDPEYYPNPEVFDPDRFTPENSMGRHPYSYIPFSAGPRNCIGQKFAMLEEKTVIANILRHFRVQSLDPRDKIVECGELVLRPVEGIQIKFVERQK